ncbi:response regulator [Wenxinia saemankumensis]|uniref:Response regulator receiver domain-containing protein n=1 Tax=Wenxinia saemankumensis TaxID=1447782 RepID=A0A1M6GKB9_9RHOB|nr:response regulator [Wenxinia saemankumensis]SHJ10336.1 Response regulator receiver domain-containing protein [Wenxinia saemankumensis]
MDQTRVLILEDELLLLLDLSLMIEDAGWQSVPAGNVGTAITILAEHAPDVAILNLLMPDGGTSEAAAIRCSELGVPFLLYTGAADLSGEWIRRLSPVILSKPSSHEVIISAVRKLLSR